MGVHHPGLARAGGLGAGQVPRRAGAGPVVPALEQRGYVLPGQGAAGGERRLPPQGTLPEPARVDRLVQPRPRPPQDGPRRLGLPPPPRRREPQARLPRLVHLPGRRPHPPRRLGQRQARVREGPRARPKRPRGPPQLERRAGQRGRRRRRAGPPGRLRAALQKPGQGPGPRRGAPRDEGRTQEKARLGAAAHRGRKEREQVGRCFQRAGAPTSPRYN
mmetsp:Transcript_13493/g.31971  ORF Transcript_13493/g.31971 Transcript_13493/m.31971 type:complete len:218 (+) Transcript_13493:296-949(+)